MAKLFVLTGPSGAGKSSVAKALFSRYPESLQKFITCTTREPRPGEQHGKDYWFLSPAEFEQRKAEQGFFEWALVYGHSYGSSTAEMERVLAGEKPVLIILDVQGAKTVKHLYPQTTLLFLDAPKNSLLQRLEERGTDAEDLKRRAAKIDEEERFRGQADIIISNADGELEQAIEAARQAIFS